MTWIAIIAYASIQAGSESNFVDSNGSSLCDNQWFIGQRHEMQNRYAIQDQDPMRILSRIIMFHRMRTTESSTDLYQEVKKPNMIL